jgi:hypothetical protein
MTDMQTPVYDWLIAQPQYRKPRQQPRHRRLPWWQRLFKVVA